MPIYKINSSQKPPSWQHHNSAIHPPDLNCVPCTANEIHNSNNNNKPTNEPKSEEDDNYKTSEITDASHFASLKRHSASSRAQETIVEKEIRKQLEKEREIKSLHSSVLIETTKIATNDEKDASHKNDLPNGHAKMVQVPGVAVSKSLEYESGDQGQLDAVKTNFSTSQDSSARDVRQRIHKRSVVQPFEDAEEELEVKLSFIQPQNETVIEKEIRLARQREGSLRRARGNLLQVHQTENEAKVPVPVMSTNGTKTGINVPQGVVSTKRTSEFDNPKKEENNARRLATNRLKQEIMKERQREMDLIKLGKIKTLSEERAALDVAVIEELVAKELEERKRLEIHKNSSLAQGVPVKTLELHLSPPCELKMEKCNSLNKKVAPRSVPLENIRYNDTHMDAETRIEEEIKEIKRREEELRNQRVQMGLSPTVAAPSNNLTTFITSYRRR